MAKAAIASPASLAQQLLSQTSPHYNFNFTPFLQKTYQHSLPADRPICKAFAAGHCPLKTHCPERHSSSGSGSGGGYGGKEQGFGSLVCKHWLRGLCKKGESCEFLHEYNLRKMPECNFFVRNGYCSNGDECLYLHVDPESRLPPCPHYDRGFCPLGPRCEKKHVRRPLCLCFLAGFCPNGRTCRDGAHAKWTRDKDMEKPRAKQDRTPEEEAALAAAKAEEQERARERDRERMERERERDIEAGGDGRGYGHKDRFGARGRGWRGKGRFRGGRNR
jgi:cleavage and polyadenylation specificity factor subunit 4